MPLRVSLVSRKPDLVEIKIADPDGKGSYAHKLGQNTTGASTPVPFKSVTEVLDAMKDGSSFASICALDITGTSNKGSGGAPTLADLVGFPLKGVRMNIPSPPTTEQAGKGQEFDIELVSQVYNVELERVGDSWQIQSIQAEKGHK